MISGGACAGNSFCFNLRPKKQHIVPYLFAGEDRFTLNKAWLAATRPHATTMNHSSPPVWVIGSSNVDLIMKMSRLPSPCETVTDATFVQTFGGKGANSAVAAARAGASVVFVSAVGNDPHAPVLLGNLETDGIDVRHVWREQDIPSGHALVMIGEGGKNYISVAPGANNRVTPWRIESLKDELANAGRILIQNEIPPAANRKVLDLARQAGVPVQWNFAPFTEVPAEWLMDCELLILNESEALGLAKQHGFTETDFPALAAALRRLCPRGVVITLGADGVEAATPEFDGHLPAFRVTPVDTTGAGDIFCGALGAAMVGGDGLASSIRFASAAAAISVTRLGAQRSAPLLSEIAAILNEKTANQFQTS